MDRRQRASLYRDIDGDKTLDKGKDTPFWPDGRSRTASASYEQ